MSASSSTIHNARVAEILNEELDRHYRRISRMFAWLMGVQWLGAIAAALIISPWTWIGDQNRVHQHVWIAIIMGGVLSSLPIAVALRYPTRTSTRHIIAVSQMLFGALLIHLTGGRVETHFHVFGSLAFLALYRDWRVLVTATVVVSLDHMIRGIFIPLSVFGTSVSSSWRWLEHAGWVVFEDVILAFSCVKGLAEMRNLADRQAHLEHARDSTELAVQERTRQLKEANVSLEHNQSMLSATNAELVATAKEREMLHDKLLTASREAGMAEVAIGVLHNVGNILNSVNVSANVVSQQLRTSEVPNLVLASGLLEEHANDLPEYLRHDDRGRHLPTFLIQVAKCLSDENKSMQQEVEAVKRGVDHIKHVISLQQSHAKNPSLVDLVRPEELAEMALQMQQGSLSRQDVTIVCPPTPLESARLDKHRVLQILINLLSNARQATRDLPAGSARMVIRVSEVFEDSIRKVRFEVIDNGIGISKDNLDRLFVHGFTTREDGHGFGLHTAATAAQAMGGHLSARSDGPGTGATFELLLPVMDKTVRESITNHAGHTSPASTEGACIAS